MTLLTRKKSVRRGTRFVASASNDDSVIVIGNYKTGQLDWIKKNGVYNWPVREDDGHAGRMTLPADAQGRGERPARPIQPDDLAKVNELWLYANAKSERHVFSAEFVGKMTAAEFRAAYPTYAKLGASKQKAYYVFKAKPVDYPPELGSQIVLARTADFGRRCAKVKKAVEQFKRDGEFAPLAAYLPKELGSVPSPQLRVCEAAVQLEFLSKNVECNAGFYMLENTEVLSSGADDKVLQYLGGHDVTPLFVCGESLSVLRGMPDNCIDCCMTSPPYWNKRLYLDGGIGLEPDYRAFIDNLVAICAEIKRVLKSTGSFWLNIGDSYLDKNLLNIPSRVAIRLQDEQGWILRNTIIWNKVKGCPDNSLDKLRNIYEPIFHFVKKEHGYYYDVDSVRHKPHQTKVVNGAVVSATGVTGIRYKRKIEMSTVLTEDQKRNAMTALDDILSQVQRSEISDFRMIIKGDQRTTHSDAESVSGRARELHEKGFYFLKYNPKGCKPSDLWEIIPEDSQGRKTHFAPYPEDLCKMPIQLTCPRDGVVLDPFSGTGTTAVVSMSLGRKSIGIDISKRYIDDAKKRICERFAQGLLAL